MIRKYFLFFIASIVSCSITVLAGVQNTETPTPFKNNTCRTDFGSYIVSDGSSAEVMADFVRSHMPNLQNKQNGIALTFSQNSPGGYHYTFTQTYAGIPVFASDIVVNVSMKNTVYSIFDDSYDMSKWTVRLADFNYQTVGAYQAYVKQYFSENMKVTAQKVIAYDASNGAALLCYLINLKDASGHQRDVLVAPDKILYEHDACMHRAAGSTPDSLVTGLVFRPDPLTTAHVVYDAPYLGQDSAYQNFNDSDTYQLNIQRKEESFYADYNAGTFSLQNKYVQLVQLGSGPAPVTSDTPAFNFTRSQTGFLDVMVFYHLNTIRNYVHSLGFNSADTLIMPDSHALTADDDFFSEPNNIYYGTGGVPDCQDADVIVHEYTHFISWNSNHSNGAGSSPQRNSVDEGSADYDAASYSASIDTFKWNYIFNWDGHNEFWPGRVCDDMTVYPTQPSASGVQGIYRYAETWSSSLMQIWWAIGKGPADSLFFQTLYGLAGNITLPDAAQQYLKADSLLFNGKYHCTIANIFNQHGLLYTTISYGNFINGNDTLMASPSGAHYQWLMNGVPISGATSQTFITQTDAGYSVIVSNGTGCVADTSVTSYPSGINQINSGPQPFTLLTYPDGFKAVSTQADTHMDITLYDISGRQLASYTDVSTEIKPDLPVGVYIVEVSAQGYHQGFKWVNVK